MNEAFLCACFVPCHYWWLKYEDTIWHVSIFVKKQALVKYNMKLSFYNVLKMSVFLHFKAIFSVIFVTCEFFLSVVLCIWQSKFNN